MVEGSRNAAEKKKFFLKQQGLKNFAYLDNCTKSIFKKKLQSGESIYQLYSKNGDFAILVSFWHLFSAEVFKHRKKLKEYVF